MEWSKIMMVKYFLRFLKRTLAPRYKLAHTMPSTGELGVSLLHWMDTICMTKNHFLRRILSPVRTSLGLGEKGQIALAEELLPAESIPLDTEMGEKGYLRTVGSSFSIGFGYHPSRRWGFGIHGTVTGTGECPTFACTRDERTVVFDILWEDADTKELCILVAEDTVLNMLGIGMETFDFEENAFCVLTKNNGRSFVAFGRDCFVVWQDSISTREDKHVVTIKASYLSYTYFNEVYACSILGGIEKVDGETWEDIMAGDAKLEDHVLVDMIKQRCRVGQKPVDEVD